MTNEKQLDRATILALLLEHEWEVSDDHRHVLCATCGARTRAKAKPRHKRNCLYQALVSMYSAPAPTAADKSAVQEVSKP